MEDKSYLNLCRQHINQHNLPLEVKQEYGNIFVNSTENDHIYTMCDTFEQAYMVIRGYLMHELV